MVPSEEIAQKREEIAELCGKLGVLSLNAHIEGSDDWKSVVFVGDFDGSRLTGYADRFFDTESGLLRIFHRRVLLVEKEMFPAQQVVASHRQIELQRAS